MTTACCRAQALSLCVVSSPEQAAGRNLKSKNALKTEMDIGKNF